MNQGTQPWRTGKPAFVSGDELKSGNSTIKALDFLNMTDEN